eukprot:XP_017449389.1 PREDICTED: uncharacterized protein LOC108351075 [Rattus norvegicus]
MLTGWGNGIQGQRLKAVALLDQRGPPKDIIWTVSHNSCRQQMMLLMGKGLHSCTSKVSNNPLSAVSCHPAFCAQAAAAQLPLQKPCNYASPAPTTQALLRLLKPCSDYASPAPTTQALLQLRKPCSDYSSPAPTTQALLQLLKPCSDYASPAPTTQALLRLRKPCSDYASPAPTTQALLRLRKPCSDYASPAPTTQAQHNYTFSRCSLSFLVFLYLILFVFALEFMFPLVSSLVDI